MRSGSDETREIPVAIGHGHRCEAGKSGHCDVVQLLSNLVEWKHTMNKCKELIVSHERYKQQH